MKKSYETKCLETRSSIFSFTKLIKFWILSYLTCLTLIFCYSNICEAAYTKLIWNESTEAKVTGYYLYYGTKPDIYTNSVQIVGKSNTDYLIKNLNFTPAQAYYIAVTAYTDTGEESTYSNEVMYSDYSLIPQSQLSIVSVDSEELVAEDGAAENAIDGLSDTFWLTEWYQSEPTCPHEIVIHLGNLYVVGGFQYLTRQDGNINGTIAEYSIYVSKDGITWGEAVATGTFIGDTTKKEVTFTGKIGRYVRFVALSEVNENPWSSAAEINVLETVLPADSDGDGIIDDDEIDIYGTNPDKADTDGDGISDGEEVALWGDDYWYADDDGDGIINLLDSDADGDGILDGAEIELGTDPAYPDTPDYSLIPQSQLSIVSVDSEELVAEDGHAENAIDGLSDTFWVTEWYQSEPTCPHEIVIDLGDLYVVGGFQYLTRQDGGINGTVAEYSIYISKDGILWGEAVATGTFIGDTTKKEVTFTGKIGRYVRFVALSEVNENPWSSAAEINVLETVLPADSDGDGIIDDDEIDIYGTNPDKADTDGDGISDGEEVALWGDDYWYADDDGDGIINLLDSDADGDGILDGAEIELGTDPAYPDTPDYSLIPQSQLSIVSVDSEELVAEDGHAENAIDGLSDTFWVTEWYQSEPTCPHEIVIDLGDLYVVGGFQYLTRQDGGINGTVAEYSIYISKDGILWGEAVATGTFAGDTTEKEVTFAGKSGRYVRFVAMSEVNGNPWSSAAEINVLGTLLLY